MPQQEGSNSPSGDADSEALSRDPSANFPEERVVRHVAADNSNDQEEHTEAPSGKVHWINHATFILSIILAVLTAGTLRVYDLQLQQMAKQTSAAESSSYAACVSAQIARRTLLEIQSGEADTHNSSAAAVAQVAVTTRGESPIISWGINITAPTEPSGPPNLFEWNSWRTVNSISLQGINVGRSAADSARIKYLMQLLPRGVEPSLSAKHLPLNYTGLGVWGGCHSCS